MRLIVGDCLEVLASLQEASLDACVTDAPYELGFMGKAWDRTGVAFREATWRAVGRVLKPGAHLLAFGGTRTFHRIACAIEDAGFEIRDCLCWLYGSGFPKSLDVSKAIDEAAGHARGTTQDVRNGPNTNQDTKGNKFGGYETGQNNIDGGPVSEDAAAWSGWGTALKPAWEPIIVARKPLIGTVAENVLRHGTGGINVEACRLDYRGNADEREAKDKNRHADFGSGPMTNHVFGEFSRDRENYDPSGRWPANACMDEQAAAMVDEQAGDRPTGDLRVRSLNSGWKPNGRTEEWRGACGDSGGASRFFYVAKASRAEREEGCRHLPLRTAGEATDREDCTEGLNSPRAGASRTSGARNFHPTVKPIELMRWLVRLVTPPGGHVLDPFTGSGTTGIACDLEGFDFTGIELDPEYARIAQARLDYWNAIPKQMRLP